MKIPLVVSLYNAPILPIVTIQANAKCSCRKPDCASPGKHPMVRYAPHGVRSATTDPATIAAWPMTANVAMSLGHVVRDGRVLVCLDVDGRNGGFETLATLPAVPETVRAVSGSGNGVHYFFAAPADVALVGSLGAGLDLLSAGKYVLIEPSRHASGGTYRWDSGAHPSETTLADMPMWMLDRTSKGVKKAALPSSGADAKFSWLGQAFAAAGWLGDVLPDGRRLARCPWFDGHSVKTGDGGDSSCVLFPRADGKMTGAWHCAHGSCARRTYRDVVRALPERARRAADLFVRFAGRAA